MDVKINPVVTIEIEESRLRDVNIVRIVHYLVENIEIQFKSQQRDESELTKIEKREIALQLFNRNKFNFICRYGKYFKPEDIDYFKKFIDESEVGLEIEMILKNLERYHSKDLKYRDKRNRRYDALTQYIKESSYFSETEMMKRNPLLYDQLVGQFLSEDERRERDRAHMESTFVNILMEGIERDNAKDVKKEQELMEDNAMEEEDTSDEEDNNDKPKCQLGTDEQPSCSRWGEFEGIADTRINKSEFYVNCRKPTCITDDEKALLKDEFVTLMHQSFLDGKDEDFDYNTVDDNEIYDNIDILTADEEEKYFDSESPEDTQMVDDAKELDDSEDELEIYMKSLQQHQTICDLSKGLQKL